MIESSFGTQSKVSPSRLIKVMERNEIGTIKQFLFTENKTRDT